MKLKQESRTEVHLSDASDKQTSEKDIELEIRNRTSIHSIKDMI